MMCCRWWLTPITPAATAAAAAACRRYRRPLCVISHHGNRACASLPVSGQTKAALWTVRPARTWARLAPARLAIIIGTRERPISDRTDRRTDGQTEARACRTVPLLYIERHRRQFIKVWHSARPAQNLTSGPARRASAFNMAVPFSVHPPAVHAAAILRHEI